MLSSTQPKSVWLEIPESIKLDALIDCAAEGALSTGVEHGLAQFRGMTNRGVATAIESEKKSAIQLFLSGLVLKRRMYMRRKVRRSGRP
jgi:hypothetical protein